MQERRHVNKGALQQMNLDLINCSTLLQAVDANSLVLCAMGQSLGFMLMLIGTYYRIKIFYLKK